MDIIEFRHLMDQIVATRNAESQSFLQAFDLAPAVMRNSAAQTNVKWDIWGRNNKALQTAMTTLQVFLATEADQMTNPGNENDTHPDQRVPQAPHATPR